MPRDRNGEFEPVILKKHQACSNEIEEKIIYLYGKGLSDRNISETLRDIYGIEISAATISTITDKIMGLVQEWQNRPLEPIYPIIYLDAIHLNIRLEGQVENTAVYNVIGSKPGGVTGCLRALGSRWRRRGKILAECGDRSTSTGSKRHNYSECGWVEWL